MPSGKIHALVTTISAGASLPAVYLLTDGSIERTLAFTGGCLLGLIVTPDLDHHQPTRSYTLVRRSAGEFAAFIWRLFWFPYSYAIPHRSPLSHFPVLGTTLRVLYILVVLWLVWEILTAGLGLAIPFPQPVNNWLYGFVGLAFVDALHAFMDWYWPD